MQWHSTPVVRGHAVATLAPAPAGGPSRMSLPVADHRTACCSGQTTLPRMRPGQVNSQLQPPVRVVGDEQGHTRGPAGCCTTASYVGAPDPCTLGPLVPLHSIHRPGGAVHAAAGRRPPVVGQAALGGRDYGGAGAGACRCGVWVVCINRGSRTRTDPRRSGRT